MRIDDHISRRSFFALAAGAAFVPRLALAEADSDFPALLDHFILGCDDLDRGINFVESRTGVRAAFGGVHPGRGSRNALLKLGERRYLEILAPDPAQDRSLDPLIRALAAAHIETKPIFPGSRKRPDGEVLRWRALNLKDNRGGLLPFFIEWSADSAHPASDSPAGCELTSFAVIDLDPGSLRATFRTLQLEDVQVEAGPRPRLRAVVKGPKGTLEL